MDPSVGADCKDVFQEKTTIQQVDGSTIIKSVQTSRKLYIAKNPFRRRNSRLHGLVLFHKESEFRGFYNLACVGTLFFFLATIFHRVMYEGHWAGLQHIPRTLVRWDLFLYWMGMVAASFSVVIFEKIRVKRWLQDDFLNVLEHTATLGMLLGGVSTVLDKSWNLSASCFYLTQALILTMKMHSYVMTNRDLALEQECKAKGSPHSPLYSPRKKQAIQQTTPNGNEQKEMPSQGDVVAEYTSYKYPDNLTFRNYFMFLLYPTLVYELNYPITEKIRWSYVAEKAVAFIGIYSCMWVLTDAYIKPFLAQSPHMSAVESIIHLIMPVCLFYLFLFFLVFEVYCNAVAELTHFGDREFYSDWWNSTTFDEFARKWNRPVHEWLLRHVYFETIHTYRLNRMYATIVTFLLSSIVHELFVAANLRMFKPWLFFMQMMQLPLIVLGRLFKGTRMGNIVFWISLSLGPPVLSIMYARDFISLELNHMTMS